MLFSCCVTLFGFNFEQLYLFALMTWYFFIVLATHVVGQPSLWVCVMPPCYRVQVVCSGQ